MPCRPPIPSDGFSWRNGISVWSISTTPPSLERSGFTMATAVSRKFLPIGSFSLNYLLDPKSKTLPPIGQVRLEFESGLLQRRVTCEPDFLDQIRKFVKCSGAIGSRNGNHPFANGGPMLRIHLPPAASQQPLGPARREQSTSRKEFKPAKKEQDDGSRL